MKIGLYNSLSRAREDFTPRDPNRVSLYVCGPTVYDRAHLGNARSVVVYDVLYRLLCHVYGEAHVIYARNITDVDDKINAGAIARGISIQALTQEVTGWFHEDMDALGVLPPSEKISQSNALRIEPKATDHIPHMITMIERLISNGHAYLASEHVLFEVASLPSYGVLSGRIQADLEAGARVQVESYKRHPSDFVLWKPADSEDDPSSVFPSPWGPGRPGWHIECSAMSTHYLGADFDIHGGGSDLMFPHHENEIAQSVAAFPGSHFAHTWVHNGFLTVRGEKMSKSLGNFTTVHDLLARGVRGEAIRYALLKTKYREPLDWSDKLVEDARKELDGFYRRKSDGGAGEVPEAFLEALADDLNTPRALSLLHDAQPEELGAMGELLGILQQSPSVWFKGESDINGDEEIQRLIDARIAAKKVKSWPEADKIRAELKARGILLEDRPDGSTDWRRG